MLTLTQTLTDYPVSLLRAIADARGLQSLVHAATPAALAVELSAALADPGSIVDAVERLPETAQTLLAALVQAGGTVVSDNEYGRRSMAYEIAHQPDVDYSLLQFQGPASLLEQLSRTLRITDGVVRFRVIKIRPDAPAAPDLRQSAVPAPETAEPVAEPAAAE